MGDFNDEVNINPISTFFSSLQIHNVIHTLFPTEYQKAPCTFTRGRSTIDAMFATQGVQALRGGYLPPHYFESDHVPIWADFYLETIFGTNRPLQPPLQCRRLKNEDPRVVKNSMLNTTNYFFSINCQQQSTISSPTYPSP